MTMTSKEKADAGMFLSLRELAEVLGFSHPRMCQIAKRPGFPLFEGRVRHPEFLEWYRSTLPSLTQPQPIGKPEAAPDEPAPVVQPVSTRRAVLRDIERERRRKRRPSGLPPTR